MSSQRRMQPRLEVLDRRELPSRAMPFHPRNVDITGEVMRMNVTTPPRTMGRAARVYSMQGQGGVDELGSVQIQGSVTDTVRGGAHAYKGKLVLANTQGTVSVKFTGSSYRITGGTGAYRGATGLGVVTYGTVGDNLVGLAFSGDH